MLEDFDSRYLPYILRCNGTFSVEQGGIDPLEAAVICITSSTLVSMPLVGWLRGEDNHLLCAFIAAEMWCAKPRPQATR